MHTYCKQRYHYDLQQSTLKLTIEKSLENPKIEWQEKCIFAVCTFAKIMKNALTLQTPEVTCSLNLQIEIAIEGAIKESESAVAKFQNNFIECHSMDCFTREKMCYVMMKYTFTHPYNKQTTKPKTHVQLHTFRLERDDKHIHTPNKHIHPQFEE